jgi:RHS repeat-associated protein
LLDGEPSTVELVATWTHDWSLQWRTALELKPGPHQLSVSAAHPSGLFTTNATVWFTNNAANEIVSDSFNGAGLLTNRIWRSATGATNRTQTLTWDLKKRLTHLSEIDSQRNGYEWSAGYDSLGRRFWSSFQTESNSASVGLPIVIDSFFDPSVEFLELGVGVGNVASYSTTWKLYGPDLNGQYGGLNGAGGLDAVMPQSMTLNPTISDSRGNVLAVVTNGVVSWNPSRPTGYGAVPGYRPLPLGAGANLGQAAVWREHWSDISGYVWLGARYYDPVAGAFLSSDPVWNGRDPNYYTFCGGDPINYTDPDGRCTEQQQRSQHGNIANNYTASQAGSFGAFMATGDISSLFRDETDFLQDLTAGATKGSYATDAGPGAGLGQTAASFIPVYGQIGAVRDLSASAYNLRDGGWQQGRNWLNLGLSAVGAIPAMGWIKGGIQAERAGAGAARIGLAAETGANDLFATTMRQVENLDFTAGANKAVFYSGPGNRARALSFADRAGATPIDLTPGGQYLNSLNLYDTLPAAQADAIWATASQSYASGASGQINLFVRGARPDRVFNTIESPLIEANSNIYKQTFHY